jgi:hypothetical protein
MATMQGKVGTACSLGHVPYLFANIGEVKSKMPLRDLNPIAAGEVYLLKLVNLPRFFSIV